MSVQFSSVQVSSVQFSSVQFYLTKTLVNLQHVIYITKRKEKFDKEQIYCSRIYSSTKNVILAYF